jgi:hypothetical protein
MTGHNETHADVGRTGTNGVAADRMIVAYSRSNGAATNCEIARGDRGAAAPEGRGRFLDPDRSVRRWLQTLWFRSAQLGHVAAPASLLVLAS